MQSFELGVMAIITIPLVAALVATFFFKKK